MKVCLTPENVNNNYFPFLNGLFPINFLVYFDSLMLVFYKSGDSSCHFPLGVGQQSGGEGGVRGVDDGVY